jgi:DMSO reductase anchor subunit
MIYACLRFIEEWAHPLTIVNFTLIGLSRAWCWLRAGGTAPVTPRFVTRPALGAGRTLAAWLGTRFMALRRNAALRHRSTLQSATGIRAPALVQTSMGMSAGAFNTREFFHASPAGALRHVRARLPVLAFPLPALLLLWALLSQCHAGRWLLALLVQAPGCIAERWFFFAQARHPQNLYYQVVS